MKVKKLIVEKFRHLENLEIPIGEQLTAIAGQNGTGKSVLLGLIGHVFKFDSMYKTLNDKSFKSIYSEVFRFSYPNFDKPKDHRYKIELDTGKVISTSSTERIQTGKPKELRLVVGQRIREGGNVVHPVIYLGLKRLFPLAQENIIKYPPSILTPKEIEEYRHYHNAILLLSEGNMTPEKVYTRNKTSYAVRTPQYDSLGNSAGQDNLGQILTAIFSFKRLKNILQNNYEGGILLIDEIEATLYPAAQEKLIQHLFKISGELDLQVIFTTQSIETLQIINSNYKNTSEIIYLSKVTGKVEVERNLGIQKMIGDLQVKPPTPYVYLAKTHIYCEDKEARYFLIKLLLRNITKNIEVIPEKFGGDELCHLAAKRVTEFKKSIFVVDGDINLNVTGRRKAPNIIALPGKCRPENLLFNFLQNLSPSDDFWGTTGGYTQQVCFKDCSTIGDREVMKKWFNAQLPYWGLGAAKLINRWKKDNPKEVEAFQKEFARVYNKVKA